MKFKQIIKNILDAIDPTIVMKIWEVSIDDYRGGHFETFWLKKNAIKYFNKNKKTDLFVSLTNSITEKTIARVDNHKGTPIMIDGRTVLMPEGITPTPKNIKEFVKNIKESK